MKRICIFLCLALSMPLFASSCTVQHSGTKSANAVFSSVQTDTALLTSAALEMQAFGEERIYVAMEAEESETESGTDESSTAPTPEPQTADSAPRLVSFLKESGERTEIENSLLQQVLEQFGLSVIFFQTASDARQSVIFSYTREKDTAAIQNGFYYSFDSAPCAWWGRKGELKHNKTRFVQSNADGSAWYFTIPITESFFYFEKSGDLLA